MAQMGFLIKSAQCSGCKACELACKDIHNFEIGPRARRVREVCGGGWSVDEKTGVCHPSGVFTYSVSYSCGHCDNPACVAVCPTGAHAKDEETGLVTIDQEQCIGCKSCMEACPYDVRRLIENEPEYYLELPIGDPAAKSHKGGTVEKCDFCAGRIDRGEKPACMELCPGRARYWGDLDDPESEVSQFLSGRNATVLLEEEGTSPSVYYVS